MRRKPRSAAEFRRIYGSKARVVAIHALACHACGMESAECVHLENGGMGRKAGWQTVVDLGHRCHMRLHSLGSVDLFDAEHGTDLRARAAFLAEFLSPDRLSTPTSTSEK